METTYSIKLRIKILGRNYDQTEFYDALKPFYFRLYDFVVAYSGNHSLDSYLGYSVGCFVWTFSKFNQGTYENSLVKLTFCTYEDYEVDELIRVTSNVNITLK